MDHDFDRLIDDALETFWHHHPVDATFAGETRFDAALPPADAGAEDGECRAFAALERRLAAATLPDDAAARIDARHLAAACGLAQSAYGRRARYRNPAWYSGEAVFGIISLLLAPTGTEAPEALRTRIAALPDFFAAAAERLRGVAIPAAWAARAHAELRALALLLTRALPLHPAGAAIDAAAADAAAAACERFAAVFADAPDADAACGAAHLAFIVGHVHGLRVTPAELEREAAAAFERTRAELEEHAQRLAPGVSWREQFARLAEIGPSSAGKALASYGDWHTRALEAARDLVTGADDYGLTFAPLPAWAQPVAAECYFLFYRAPAARNPGRGSTYWVAPPAGGPAEIARAHNTAAVKLVHAVHHGSIGHHTQNARARGTRSRFARIAGTDGSSAIVLPSGGTMVEGWACYAEDLLAEVPDFYTPAERLQLIYFELRNIASALADIRFHTGAYTLDAMRAFYREDVAFAPARVCPETTRNSMFPGSRLMYWSGSRQIKTLRAASSRGAKAFHDGLLAFGATPIAWIAEELAR